MKTSAKIIVLVCFFVCLSFHIATAAERIVSFHSDIELAQDSFMLVTETIRVVAEGREIKRGIFRDFPIAYKDAAGNTQKVSFKVVKVLRDGEEISYKIKREGSSRRVYMGDFNKSIPSGEYTFTLVYKTTNHVRFDTNSEQLYYNITGDKWSFPIIESSASIWFPSDVDSGLIKYEAYTGKFGSREKSIETQVNQDNSLFIQSTRILNPSEGLTVNIYFPKGSFVQRSFGDFQLFGQPITANMINIGGLVIILAYFFIVWLFVGKDPAKGEIHFRALPPQNVSPALMRYILKMDYDDKMLTCALISMANKGYLTIEEKKDGFSIVKKSKANKQLLSVDERTVAKHLVSNKRIMLSGMNYKKIKAAIDALHKSLKKQADRVYFYRNTKYWFPGLLLSLVYVPLIISLNYQSFLGLLAGLILLTVILNLLFLHLMKAPTKKGRQVLDEVEGYKKYLLEKKKFVERSSYAALESYYEQNLAYAVALDIENVWESNFKEVASCDEFRAQSRLNEYCPGWYLGGNWWGVGGIGSVLHSLNHSYVVSPPAGSGGLSSGGYGGGGGGGGCAGGGSGGGGGGGF